MKKDNGKSVVVDDDTVTDQEETRMVEALIEYKLGHGECLEDVRRELMDMEI